MNKNNSDLIQALAKKGIIHSKEVSSVMNQIDRKFYAPYSPYMDSPQSIGYGATISAPHMHAYALEFLKQNLLKAKKILDVGSGTGYLTIAMALMAPQAKVYAIQHVPALVEMSIKNINNSHPQILKENIDIQVGDGRMGWAKDKDLLFDVIHVGAAPEKIPQLLLQQLAEGGRMIIPVGGVHQVQDFVQINKIGGQIKKTIHHAVRYVPLTDLEYQLKNK